VAGTAEQAVQAGAGRRAVQKALTQWRGLCRVLDVVLGCSGLALSKQDSRLHE
jgi:hypothetical protein